MCLYLYSIVYFNNIHFSNYENEMVFRSIQIEYLNENSVLAVIRVGYIYISYTHDNDDYM